MRDITVPLSLVRFLSDGEFHSGENLGSKLGMSRAAINKHMQTLRGWGLNVYTVTGKGYCLSAPLQLLDADFIRQQYAPNTIEVLPIISSTNQYLLDKMATLQSGDACVAEYQQSGRGRRGRQWFSPFGSNLYLSMYWRLDQGPAAAMGLSLVVGVVMAEVLREFGAKEVKVKWPNDLYVHERKLAGILVEMTGKTGDVANVVIGAGINISMNNPDENIVNQRWVNLNEIMTETIDRNQLVIRLLKALIINLKLFELEGLAPFLARWNSLDNFINQPVKLIIGDKEVFGIERGINSQGALQLDENGAIKSYIGGEISLRPAEQS